MTIGCRLRVSHETTIASLTRLAIEVYNFITVLLHVEQTLDCTWELP